MYRLKLKFMNATVASSFYYQTERSKLENDCVVIQVDRLNDERVMDLIVKLKGYTIQLTTEDMRIEL